ncbi:MAG: hypothetical protein M1820_005557 [Bogoriella megaspora]|nr:MAG: hypothetical protein M1820_005557 [Bogoriella megaspora]
MKTRAKRPGKVSKESEESHVSGPILGPSDDNPGKLFVLPKGLSDQSRFIVAVNPATGKINRYLCCPKQGFFEITKISAASGTPRSWLLAEDRTTPKSTESGATGLVTPDDTQNSSQGRGEEEGYVTSSSDIFACTPYDPVFFLLPALKSKLSGSNYLSLDDYLDGLEGESSQLKAVVQTQTIRQRVDARLQSICDSVPAGEEPMYRLSTQKLTKDLLEKSQSIARDGLPVSMESRFVREALEVPVMNVRAEVITSHNSEKDDKQEEGPIQDSEASRGDEAGNATRQHEDIDGLSRLQRIRVAFKFIVGSYLPANLRVELENMLKANELLDFSNLDQHLEHVASLRSEALALRAVSSNITRKRAMEDEEAAEMRAEKKRKKDEEDFLKKNQSHGVKQLSKVDTSGMKKMSSFFKKASPKKPSK